MLLTTKGILLHKLKYGDKSLILKVFTEEFGIKSFIVGSTKGKKAKNPAGMFHPLSNLNITANFRQNQGLIRPKEVTLVDVNNELRYDYAKGSIALFIADLLFHVIQTEEKDQNLFDFIEASLQWLEHADKGYANLHLKFSIQLTKFIGFSPVHSPGNFFDLHEGVFTDVRPIHPMYDEGEKVLLLNKLIGTNFDQLQELKWNRQQRNEVLELILGFFRLHIHKFPELKSLEVLKQIME